MRLRAALWDALYARISGITTVITSPLGTGKERAARAAGLAGYALFDPKPSRFADTPTLFFHPVNLSALSPTLLEPKLFAHPKGAFTGTLCDRTGPLEACPSFGAVFLGEPGGLGPGIQVKFLRILRDRSSQRVGEGLERRTVKSKVSPQMLEALRSAA